MSGTTVARLFVGLISIAWMTHVFTCMADDRWGFLIAGAVVFPIAVAHGAYVWVGAF